jgi:hypothetical protein
MKTMALLLSLICCALFVASCTSEDPSLSQSAASDDETTIEAIAANPPSAEALYIYNSKTGAPNKLTLALAGEPVLFPSGYVRLAGVVSGRRQVAYIEIGGRGLALREGEFINDYRVARITDHSVLLERGK